MTANYCAINSSYYKFDEDTCLWYKFPSKERIMCITIDNPNYTIFPLKNSKVFKIENGKKSIVPYSKDLHIYNPLPYNYIANVKKTDIEDYIIQYITPQSHTFLSMVYNILNHNKKETKIFYISTFKNNNTYNYIAQILGHTTYKYELMKSGLINLHEDGVQFGMNKVYTCVYDNIKDREEYYKLHIKRGGLLIMINDAESSNDSGDSVMKSSLNDKINIIDEEFLDKLFSYIIDCSIKLQDK